jgi:hypothetical protein
MEYHDTTIWRTAVADNAPKVILESTSFRYFPKLDRRFYDEATEFLSARGFRHIIDVRRIDEKGCEAGLDRKTLCRLLCDSTGTILCRLFHRVFGTNAGKTIEFNIMFDNGISITAVNASLSSRQRMKKSAFFYHSDFLKTMPKSTSAADFYLRFKDFMAELPQDEAIRKMMTRRLIDTSRIDNAIRLMQCMYSSSCHRYDRDIYTEPYVFPGMRKQVSGIDFETLCRSLQSQN